MNQPATKPTKSARKITPMCAWCAGHPWGNTEASGLYQGTVWNEDSGRTMPFKAWLCEMHQDDSRIEAKRCIKTA